MPNCVGSTENGVFTRAAFHFADRVVVLAVVVRHVVFGPLTIEFPISIVDRTRAIFCLVVIGAIFWPTLVSLQD